MPNQKEKAQMRRNQPTCGWGCILYYTVIFLAAVVTIVAYLPTIILFLQNSGVL